jgi:hypothetical protein
MSKSKTFASNGEGAMELKEFYEDIEMRWNMTDRAIRVMRKIFILQVNFAKELKEFCQAEMKKSSKREREELNSVLEGVYQFSVEFQMASAAKVIFNSESYKLGNGSI